MERNHLNEYYYVQTMLGEISSLICYWYLKYSKSSIEHIVLEITVLVKPTILHLTKKKIFTIKISLWPQNIHNYFIILVKAMTLLALYDFDIVVEFTKP